MFDIGMSQRYWLALLVGCIYIVIKQTEQTLFKSEKVPFKKVVRDGILAALSVFAAEYLYTTLNTSAGGEPAPVSLDEPKF